MTDIRKACKIFLDFVYESNIIPDEIVKKLKDSAFFGDIRKICSILQYNSNYKKKDNDDLFIENDVYLFNSLDKQRLQWLKSPFIGDELNHLKSICNAFFIMFMYATLTMRYFPAHAPHLLIMPILLISPKKIVTSTR